MLSIELFGKVKFPLVIFELSDLQIQAPGGGGGGGGEFFVWYLLVWGGENGTRHRHPKQKSVLAILSVAAYSYFLVQTTCVIALIFIACLLLVVAWDMGVLLIETASGRIRMLMGEQKDQGILVNRHN